MRSRSLLPAALLVLALSIASASGRAALIATGDGTGNTSAPSPDPGFARVGSVNGLSAVYARNGWVLTANHVGTGTFYLSGTSYPALPGSTVRFRNDDGTWADLIAFKLASRPPLPDVAITDSAPTVGTLITVIGRGVNRGAPTSWGGVEGFAWGTGSALRWGTNRISAVGDFVMTTRAFRILFDELANLPAGQHEADIVTGDSGGGAFVGAGASAELVGILFARAAFVGQPASTSLYGNAGVIVDLYAYRDDVLAIVDRPDCSDGLDDDGDGRIDFPADPGCTTGSDWNEREATLPCDNNLDDDRDGLRDHPADPGCDAPDDASERGAVFECDNGLDDDEDGATDYPDDPGCLHPTTPIETPEPGPGAMLAAGALALAGAARRRSPDRRRVR